MKSFTDLFDLLVPSVIFIGVSATIALATEKPQLQGQAPAETESAVLESSGAIEASPLSARLQSTCGVINKFKAMGIGVSPFEKSAESIRKAIADGNVDEASNVLDRLNKDLVDQQKRFYSGKWQSWHCDNQRMLAARAALHHGIAVDHHGNGVDQQAESASRETNGACRHADVSAAAGLSRAAHNTLSGHKNSQSPLIYPIAR